MRTKIFLMAYTVYAVGSGKEEQDNRNITWYIVVLYY